MDKQTDEHAKLLKEEKKKKKTEKEPLREQAKKKRRKKKAAQWTPPTSSVCTRCQVLNKQTRKLQQCCTDAHEQLDKHVSCSSAVPIPWIAQTNEHVLGKQQQQRQQLTP